LLFSRTNGDYIIIIIGSVLIVLLGGYHITDPFSFMKNFSLCICWASDIKRAKKDFIIHVKVILALNGGKW